MCSPQKPTNDSAPLTSIAQKPQPRCFMSKQIFCAISLLAWALSGSGKYSITCGSAFREANDSKSLSCHCRKHSRSVSNSINSAIAGCALFLKPNSVLDRILRYSISRLPHFTHRDYVLAKQATHKTSLKPSNYNCAAVKFRNITA